jgi:hypothetical protein
MICSAKRHSTPSEMLLITDKIFPGSDNHPAGDFHPFAHIVRRNEGA